MRILAASNSCPRWEAGRLLPRSPGGLVPMLIDVLDRHGGEWVFAAPPGVPPGPVPLRGDVRLHPVGLDEDLRRQHYDTISIDLLLGMLHYLHDVSRAPAFDRRTREAWVGYEKVNQAFADQLGRLARDTADEVVLLNDPHLMLVPELLAPRRRGTLVYFLGTPWAEPDYFTLLPAPVRVRILESLLRCDVVGFHAGRWVDAFVACCVRNLPDVHVDGRRIRHRGHETTMVAVPFPLDRDVLDTMRHEEAAERWRERLAVPAAGRRALVRADRMDLWKNLPRGFAAYEAALEQDPALADEYWFAAVATTPSRATSRHRDYEQLTEAHVARVNERFGRPGRDAVTLVRPALHGDSRHCVVAALAGCRAALVNSTFDGLNLFAKEAAHLMADDADLLLSVNAGVHEQLGRFATAVDPFDVDGTADAILRALRRPHDAPGAPGRRAVLAGESTAGWLGAVLEGTTAV